MTDTTNGSVPDAPPAPPVPTMQDPSMNRTLLLAKIGELTVQLGQAETIIQDLMVERDTLQRQLAEARANRAARRKSPKAPA